MKNILNFLDSIGKALDTDDEKTLNDNLTALFEEMDMPFAIFEDDFGNRFECHTDRQFDEMMDQGGLHLVFD